MLALDKHSNRNKILIFGLLLFLTARVFDINQTLQLIFFGLGILITGIPHGSLDHILYLKQQGNTKFTFSSLIRFLLFYLGYAALYAIVWYIHVELAIFIFLLISAYHFGEMDLKNLLREDRLLSKFISTVYGLVFLINYLIFRWPEASAILSGFPGFRNEQIQNISAIYANRNELLCLSILAMIIFIGTMSILQKISFQSLITTFIQLFILGLIVFNLPILLGFGFYFNCWHAVLSIIEIRKSLGWEHKPWIYLYQKSLITNLGAWFMILGMLFFFYGDFNRIMAILFIAIAILTAPHVQVISSMLAKNKTTGV